MLEQAHDEGFDLDRRRGGPASWPGANLGVGARAVRTDRYVYGPHMMWWEGGWYGLIFGPLIMILVLALTDPRLRKGTGILAFAFRV
jgi:hypothetical protein